MNWIDVISAGPGDESLLTEEARRAIQNAEVVFCAERNAKLIPDTGKRRFLTPFSAALDEMEALFLENRRAAVLVSGDAGLYSLLPVLKKRFGPEKLRVLPGVSSLQAFCARLRVSWQEAVILSAHGRDLSPSVLCHAVRTHAQTFLLLDGEHDPNWVWNSLNASGLDGVRLTVGERISYPDEHIAAYEPRTYDPLSVALVENGHPEGGLPLIGLPDNAFIRGKTPMTKREIRVQALASLALPPDAVVWDVGAGTGSVTVECARQCPMGRVYAVERDENALHLIRENIAHFHLTNAEIIAGSAPEVLESLPAPTHVFMGGTGGKTKEILEKLKGMNAPVRLCATAVTMESAQEYGTLLREYPLFSAVQIAVSRIEPVGGYHLFRAQNPVFIFSADMEGEP